MVARAYSVNQVRWIEIQICFFFDVIICTICIIIISTPKIRRTHVCSRTIIWRRSFLLCAACKWVTNRKKTNRKFICCMENHILSVSTSLVNMPAYNGEMVNASAHTLPYYKLQTHTYSRKCEMLCQCHWLGSSTHTKLLCAQCTCDGSTGSRGRSDMQSHVYAVKFSLGRKWRRNQNTFSIACIYKTNLFKWPQMYGWFHFPPFYHSFMHTSTSYTPTQTSTLCGQRSNIRCQKKIFCTLPVAFYNRTHAHAQWHNSSAEWQTYVAKWNVDEWLGTNAIDRGASGANEYIQRGQTRHENHNCFHRAEGRSVGARKYIEYERKTTILSSVFSRWCMHRRHWW